MTSRPTSAVGFSTRFLRTVRPSSMRRYRMLSVTLVLGAALVGSACTPVVLPGPPPGSPPLSVPSSAPSTVAVPPTTTAASAEPSAPGTTTSVAPDTTTTAATPATTATTSPATSSAVTPAPSLPPAGDAAVAQQVLDLVNTQRNAAGCPALVLDAQLSAAAQGHAEDMAAKNFFSHSGLDGRSPFDRITAAGYTGGGYQAENIARGQADAVAVMRGWMNSPGHRANIRNCVYDDLGVGYTRADRGPYWVQNFGGVR